MKPEVERRAHDLVLVTGISGSGKSVAMHALEDAGYFCVDNLPPELLREFIAVEHRREGGARRVAIAVDVRSAGSLPHLAPLVDSLRSEGVALRSFFLDASTDALVRRYSETRRPHPLSTADSSPRALVDAIEIERQLLSGLRERSVVVDTSQLRPAQLARWLRDAVGVRGRGLTLVFESFAFKYGVPLDADFVFDLRVLPNPHYIRELRPLTGRDAPVADYLAAQPEALEMLGQIEAFLARWLDAFTDGHRAYLTVALGCTGGQHRSVWAAEQLAVRFASRSATLLRHREQDALA
ncbi:MAG: RNase adapter RapZ [Aquincola sp.]|nr:RNase adapter RapZ [Aquincola sp.]MDH4287371.1 RNase adapter RapZ [Aquincola sp.]MDH5328850.1 RNase adapter RapZ [Aquincola sp.]